MLVTGESYTTPKGSTATCPSTCRSTAPAALADRGGKWHGFILTADLARQRTIAFCNKDLRG